jgi:hypothetical protein
MKGTSENVFINVRNRSLTITADMGEDERCVTPAA